jgi:hypothetical protein
LPGFDDDGVLTATFGTLSMDGGAGLDLTNGWVRYRVDAGAWGVWTTALTFTTGSLVDGPHTLSAELRDRVDNRVQTTTAVVIVDTLAGGGTIVTVLENSSYLYYNALYQTLYYSAHMPVGQSFVIVSNSTDVNPRLVSYGAAFGTVEHQIPEPLYNSSAYVVAPDASDINIALVFVDQAGNVAASVNLLCVKDTSAPEQPSVGGYQEVRAGEYWFLSNQSIYFGAPVDAGGAGMETGAIMYRLNGGNWTTYSSVGVSVAAFAEGEPFTVTYSAIDAVGNPCLPTTLVAKVVNYRGPTIATVVFPDVAEFNATIQVWVSDPANFSVTVSGYYEVNGTYQPIAFSYSSAGYYHGTIDLTPFAYRDKLHFYIEATNSIPVTCLDNNNGAYYRFEVGDFQRPTYQWLSYPNGTLSNDVAPDLRIRLTDPGAGVNVNEVALYYRAWQQFSGGVSWDKRSLNYDASRRVFVMADSEGWGPFRHGYTVEYYVAAQDNALTPNGVETTVFSFQVVDTTAPTVTIPLDTLQLTTDAEGYYHLTLQITDPEMITLLLLNYTADGGLTWTSIMTTDSSSFRTRAVLGVANTRTAPWSIYLGSDLASFAFYLIVGDEHANVAYLAVTPLGTLTAYPTGTAATLAALQVPIANRAYVAPTGPAAPPDVVTYEDVVWAVLAIFVPFCVVGGVMWRFWPRKADQLTDALGQGAIFPAGGGPGSWRTPFRVVLEGVDLEHLVEQRLQEQLAARRGGSAPVRRSAEEHRAQGRLAIDGRARGANLDGLFEGL